jgi:hypothetical protein
MDTTLLISYALQFSLIISSFAVFTLQAIWLGRQSVINVIVGLLLALILYQYIPFTDYLLNNLSLSQTFIQFSVFITLAIATTLLTRRIMPSAYHEGHFESFLRKLLLAFAGTIVVSIICFQVLSAESVLIQTSPLIISFLKEAFVFWWLLVVGGILWYAS